MSTPTARPALHFKRRPSSAIFVGASPVPDLPEPPSPEGTTSSGLPSPPATNSTGSGSTGDIGSTYMGSTRQKPSELNSDHSALSHDHDYDYDHEIDEDDTARLDLRQPSVESSENVRALQRVKSLTQRNKMVIDKLNRLSSPSPGPSSRNSRSPNPSMSSASSSNSSTSHSRLAASHARASSMVSIATSHQPLTRASLNSLSGSETERESNYSSHPYSASSNQYASSSNEDPSPLQPHTHRPTTPSRVRLRSAPSSPAKALTRTARRSSPGPGARTTLREVSIPDEPYSSASKRTRQPLPREFRDIKLSAEPVTPLRDGVSPAPSYLSSANQNSNHSFRAPRFSTVRDLNRKHQSRWVSEDMSHGIPEDGGAVSGRLQSIRGGSAESGLTVTGGAGGRLVEESLRAAGIVMRRDEDFELFSNTRRRLADLDRSSSRLDERRAKEPDATYGRRAATSMADYSTRHGPDDDDDDDDEVGPRTAPLRTYKSAYGLHDKQRAESSMSKYTSPQAVSTPAFNRVDPSAYGSRRFLSSQTAPGNSGGPSTHYQDGSEHTRLMAESLSMFESQLSRLPSASSPASTEAQRNAQALVVVAERLNLLLRASSTRALDEQVNAELEEADGEPGAVERAAVWRAVGGEYREQLRASDELVRGLTGLLLSVGKTIRESTGIGDDERADSAGSDSVSRRKLTTSPEAIVSSGNSRLAEVRRSWDPSPSSQRLLGRVDSILSNKGRPSSSGGRLDTRSTPSYAPTSLSRDSSTRDDVYSSAATPATTRIRDNDPRVGFKADYEPSPTPVSRNTANHDRSQTLPALTIPPPLSNSSSEDQQSQLRRSNTAALHQTESVRRPKASTAATSTVRRSPISLSIPNATTALTPHHVHNSPAVTPSVASRVFSLTRNDSKLSISSAGSSKVTFSKPSTVSVSTLNDLNERDRKRTISYSDNEAAPEVVVPITPVSGSEAERDRRKTIGLNSKTLRKSANGLNTAANGSGSRREPSQRESNTATVVQRRKPISEIFS